MIAQDALPMFEAEAKERMLSTLKHGDSPAPVALPERGMTAVGEAREHAAVALGVGSANVGRAKRIVKERPDLAGKVRSGEMTVGAAMREIAPLFADARG